jgi:hypothetical protein
MIERLLLQIEGARLVRCRGKSDDFETKRPEDSRINKKVATTEGEKTRIVHTYAQGILSSKEKYTPRSPESSEFNVGLTVDGCLARSTVPS